MDTQESGHFLRPEPEITQREKVAKQNAAQRVSSDTLQHEMRSVLSRMTDYADFSVLPILVDKHSQ